MSDKNPPFFKSGPLSVTATTLRFHRHRYALSRIENTILKRPLFVMGLAIAALLIGMTMFNADILYIHEMILAFVIAGTVTLLTYPVGTLHIQSRTLSTSGASITWLHRDLAKTQEAMEGRTGGDE